MIGIGLNLWRRGGSTTVTLELSATGSLWGAEFVLAGWTDTVGAIGDGFGVTEAIQAGSFLSTLPPSIKITSATLRLMSAGTSGGGVAFTIKGQRQASLASPPAVGATNLPSAWSALTSAGLSVPAETIPVNTWKEYVVTDIVQEILDDTLYVPGDYINLRLKSTAPVVVGGGQIYNINDAEGGWLTIVYDEVETTLGKECFQFATGRPIFYAPMAPRHLQSVDNNWTNVVNYHSAPDERSFNVDDYYADLTPTGRTITKNLAGHWAATNTVFTENTGDFLDPDRENWFPDEDVTVLGGTVPRGLNFRPASHSYIIMFSWRHTSGAAIPPQFLVDTIFSANPTQLYVGQTPTIDLTSQPLANAVTFQFGGGDTQPISAPPVTQISAGALGGLASDDFIHTASVWDHAAGVMRLFVRVNNGTPATATSGVLSVAGPQNAMLGYGVATQKTVGIAMCEFTALPATWESDVGLMFSKWQLGDKTLPPQWRQ